MNDRLSTFRTFLIASEFAVVASVATAAPPSIGQYGPFAVAPGKTVELTLSGLNLLNPRSLWTSFASRTEFVAADAESSQTGATLICRITVPRDEQVGVGAMRLVTAEGVSNPILAMVDDLPSVAASGENHRVGQAQALAWPVAVDGQCEPAEEDWFRFHVEAGQRVSFEAVAQRIGSMLDPVLRLLTQDGAEIARVDDAAGVGGDCRLSHLFESAGDYLLAIRDVRHLGGPPYRYRLRIGSFPLISAVYPAGGRSGGVASFEVASEVETKSLLHVSIPALDDEPQLAPFSVPSTGDAGSGWFHVEASPRAETLEQEPNDAADTATAAQIPGALNGRLDQPGDRDHFKFHALKGQRIHCVGRTRQLGSPCDLYLSLHKADGAQIALARQERQPVLEAEIPEEGDYTLQVEDLLRGGGADHVYRIDVSDAYGGFALNAELTQYNAPQEGTTVVKVLAQRPVYAGPIELAVEGLGEGVKLEGQIFEGIETLLKITLPADIAAGELRHVKIVGKAKIGDETVAVPANQRGPLLTMFPNTQTLPTILESTVAIGVGPPSPPYFDLAVASNEIFFPQLVGACSFEVAINRTNVAFIDAVALTVEGLPPGVTAEVAPVQDGQKAMLVSLKGPVDLSAGSEFPVRIVGTGKFQEQIRVVALEQLTLRVVKPLVVSVAVAGPILVGGVQQAEIRVQRFGNEPHAVRVHFTDGPAGLAAPIAITIPSDANAATVPLHAAVDAAPGTFNTLIAEASTSVQGQEVSVRSKPASVDIHAKPAETPLIGAPK
jgi:hypothetical protein